MFLKPTFTKIFFALVLFILSSWLWRMYIISRISDTFPHGFPLQFYLGWGPCQPNEVCFEFNSLYLFLDLAFWYLVSAFVINKFQKK
ncbi:MAG TPA: hypothetical protein DEP19_08235 [Anaerolineae bacterium]|nr:hypothetical protein [Anaerolineae bacterium]HCK65227.1 hypothetical protein [Anaerolineae bacterium]